MIRFEFIDLIKAIYTWAHGFRKHFDDQVFRITERLRRIECNMTTQADIDALVQEVADLKAAFVSKSNKILEEITKPKEEINIDALRVSVADLKATAEGSLQQLDDVNPDATPEPEETPDAGEGEDTLSGETQADHLEGQEQ